MEEKGKSEEQEGNYPNPNPDNDTTLTYERVEGPSFDCTVKATAVQHASSHFKPLDILTMPL
jgi:hypothetical protein